jgi:tetratricopeptide (TPR) repeat protein
MARFLRLTSAVATVGLVLLGAAPALRAEAPRLAEAAGDSALGAYLAGRHAMVENDRAAAARFLRQALKDDPSNEQLRRRLFWVLLGDGQVAEAVRFVDAVPAEGGDASVAALLLAIERVRAGDWAGAEERLAKLSRGSMNRFLVPLAQAWIQAGAGKTDDALATLRGIGEQSGNAVLRDLHSGLVAELAGRHDAADRFYSAALAGMQRLPLRMVEAIGGFYERRGRPADAKPLYEDYAEDNPESMIGAILNERAAKGRPTPPIVANAREGLAEALFHFASALQQDRSAEFALALTRLALHLRPDLDAAQMLVAGILEQQKRHMEANMVYEAIAPASWFKWSARLRIAANLEAMESFDEAERLLRALAKERPDRTDALAQLGGMFRTKERFLEAVDVYDEAIKRVSKVEQRHWSLFYARGIALERSKQWPRAEADFLRALELQPSQPYVLNYLGYSWIDQGVNLERGMEMIRKAVEQRPNDGYIVDSLGWAHYRLGNYDKAVEHLERAVELRPHDPTINDHLGDAYWKVGRTLEAQFQWKRAQGLKPDAELAAQIEKKLKEGLSAAAPGQRGG